MSAASPAVLLNQIDPISHYLNMISANFFFLTAIVIRNIGCNMLQNGPISRSFSLNRACE